MMSNKISLTNHQKRLVVDAAYGGHIIEFSVQGRNVLTQSGPQIGSSFWPSPESAWGWPPPAVLDSQHYRVVKADALQIVLESRLCDITGLVVTKTFRIEGSDFEIIYQMRNASTKTVSFAPWEISRVDGGLTFYEAQSAPLAKSSMTATHNQNIYWYTYQPAGRDDNRKLFANHSSGWIANVNKGLLFIKTFEPVHAHEVAPGEAEVEIYAHGDPEHPYLEIEQQGQYTQLAGEESLSWRVQWHAEILQEQYSKDTLLQKVKAFVNGLSRTALK